MKKIYLIIFLSILIMSCGKKNDPVYKEQKSRLIDNKLEMIS
tara:strand:- start:379 stop:504 length:126 start_codon:yes stop_codon:yes gene_type:complete